MITLTKDEIIIRLPSTSPTEDWFSYLEAFMALLSVLTEADEITEHDRTKLHWLAHLAEAFVAPDKSTHNMIYQGHKQATEQPNPQSHDNTNAG